MYSDAPKITCDDTEATVGQRNVQLRCYVDSRPIPQSLFWLTEPNVTLSVTSSATTDTSVPLTAAATAGQFATLVRVCLYAGLGQFSESTANKAQRPIGKSGLPLGDQSRIKTGHDVVYSYWIHFNGSAQYENAKLMEIFNSIYKLS